MKRFFVDCITEVAISEDKSVVSLTFGNFDKEGNAQPDFDIVMPQASFLKLSNFFDGLNEKLGIRTNAGNVSAQEPEQVKKTPKTIKTGSKVRRSTKKA